MASRLLCVLTVLGLVPGAVFASGHGFLPQKPWLSSEFDVPGIFQNVTELRRRSSRLFRREDCSTGTFGCNNECIADGDSCCGTFYCSQEACCGTGCMPGGSTCCESFYCQGNQACCEGGCIPVNTQCCQTGDWCYAGNECVLIGGTDQRCCTDTQCTAYVGADGYTTTNGGQSSTYVMPVSATTEIYTQTVIPSVLATSAPQTITITAPGLTTVFTVVTSLPSITYPTKFTNQVAQHTSTLVIGGGGTTSGGGGSGGGNSLSTGAIAGIAAGSAVGGIIVVAGVIFFIIMRRRRNNRPSPPPQDTSMYNSPQAPNDQPPAGYRGTAIPPVTAAGYGNYGNAYGNYPPQEKPTMYPAATPTTATAVTSEEARSTMSSPRYDTSSGRFSPRAEMQGDDTRPVMSASALPGFDAMHEMEASQRYEMEASQPDPRYELGSYGPDHSGGYAR